MVLSGVEVPEGLHEEYVSATGSCCVKEAFWMCSIHVVERLRVEGNGIWLERQHVGIR